MEFSKYSEAHQHAKSRDHFKFSAFRALGSRMLGANMRCKLFVAQQLKDLLHFPERIASEYIRRPEYPGTF